MELKQNGYSRRRGPDLNSGRQRDCRRKRVSQGISVLPEENSPLSIKQFTYCKDDAISGNIFRMTHFPKTEFLLFWIVQVSGTNERTALAFLDFVTKEKPSHQRRLTERNRQFDSHPSFFITHLAHHSRFLCYGVHLWASYRWAFYCTHIAHFTKFAWHFTKFALAW